VNEAGVQFLERGGVVEVDVLRLEVIFEVRVGLDGLALVVKVVVDPDEAFAELRQNSTLFWTTETELYMQPMSTKTSDHSLVPRITK